jgi:ATP-dependent DNA helicase RecG
MHRLLQGDVGCGKTLVALIAMVWMAEAGGQAAFLAPTEVLAQQHGARHAAALAPLGIRAATLTGGTPAAERREILRGLASGEIAVIFGTHALLQEELRFARLGLAVVDEQHRFGVAQRAALSGDGAHLLVMSATPIPRSLALTVYGDLDLSIIDEVPSTRAGVQTTLVDESQLPAVYADVAARAASGEQSYLVYPVVEESEGGDLASARQAYEELSAGPLANVRLGLLHGRMPAREKVEIGARFERGELDALVTTTVVEVGLDVHRATRMVIHQAERFGLAQLHQLRGRVGRGSLPGRCVLVAGGSIGEKGARRLRHLLASHDGFQLAQADLEERGMGELHGLRQHGQIPFRALLPFQDEALLQRARGLAQAILEEDADLVRDEHRPLGRWLDQLGRRSPFWSAAG